MRSPRVTMPSQFDAQTGMRSPQAFGDVFGLPEGEGAFAGGDAERVGVHGFGKLCRPFFTPNSE
jgi:hypothetical protein